MTDNIEAAPHTSTSTATDENGKQSGNPEPEETGTLKPSNTDQPVESYDTTKNDSRPPPTSSSGTTEKKLSPKNAGSTSERGGKENESSVHDAVPVVTAKRKAELLKKARHERRIWIEKAILPFEPSASPAVVGSSRNSDTNFGSSLPALWMTGNEALQMVQSSTICRAQSTVDEVTTGDGKGSNDGNIENKSALLPSATAVVSELYGVNHAATAEDTSEARHAGLTLDQVGERVEKLVQPFIDDENEKKKQVASAYSDDPTQSISLLSSPTPSVYCGMTSTNNNSIVKSYHDLLSKLLLPESALLVQGMRNFTLQWQGRWKSSSQAKQAASAINAYIQSTADSLSSHVAWKDRIHNNTGTTGTGDNNDDDPTSSLSIRRSMESFVYNHVYSHIINHLLVASKEGNIPVKERDDDNAFGWTLSQDSFGNKLDDLQFIQPSHLEIACLKDDAEQNSLDTLLAEPIEALLSMDMYFSPFEKLQRVLALYKTVNASLSAALNAGKDQIDTKIPTKLPSADDILPTIILVCLKARPANLLRSLEFIEVFAKSEYLRGEAGYAYTNLYGAVQFLIDLKMDETAAGSTLSITPDQLKYHLSESRKTTENKQQSVLAVASGGTGHGVNDKLLAALSRPDVGIPPFDVSEASLNLSVHDVRAARLNGEAIDITWAIKASETNRSSSSEAFHLPDGFSRSYGFLGAAPQDIRVADLPHLLQEYRLLAEVTEGLLSQQAARAAHEKKQRDLQRQAALAEEMLLLGMSST